MKIRFIRNMLLCLAVAGVLATSAVHAQTPPKMKMTTPIPPSITTPDSVETPIGTLTFFDGFPDDKTTQLVYDNLDFMRGVEAFLLGIPGGSIQAFVPAAKEFGGVDGNVMIIEDRMDSKALWLTPNNSSVYFLTWIDTTKGPIVMETPERPGCARRPLVPLDRQLWECRPGQLTQAGYSGSIRTSLA